jgi:hypothetical protein
MQTLKPVLRRERVPASPETALPRLVRSPGISVALPLLFAIGVCALAQSYVINWSTIDGGGGTSTGGVYSVAGTVGQPDAGRMSGEQFTLDGGFWGIIAAIQTPGAPTLRIYHTNGVVAVAWARPTEGWVLEATNAMPAAIVGWPRVALPYQTNATDCVVTDTRPVGNKFYRLRKN